MTVAYLANEFPSDTEPYVGEEIAELQRRGLKVISGSIRRPRSAKGSDNADLIVMQSLWRLFSGQAFLLCLREWQAIAGFARRIVQGKESLPQKMKSFAHTWLGACYAARLHRRGVDHIHVHHGYFGVSIAMVAATLLHIRYSLTLHGSDLLLRGSYLDVKLEHCAFCLTVSEYNRNYILEHYPGVDPAKIHVSRLGVIMPESATSGAAPARAFSQDSHFRLLAVGRLHVVKDHAFLIRACSRLRDLDLPFECLIAGDGPERARLESLIRKLALQDRVHLLGHVGGKQLESCYQWADLVVLTSRSEGLPLVLMEAMARNKIVLAPQITGIPELVVPGKTGFLYRPGSLEDFVSKVVLIRNLMREDNSEAIHARDNATPSLDSIREQASAHITENFNLGTNLHSFADSFLNFMRSGTFSHANPLLQ